MGGNFRRFKAKVLTIRFVKSISLALGIGLLAVGALLTLARFELIESSELYSYLAYLIVGVILLGTGLFFAFRANEKAIARRLDKEFNLNEKVQTMVAYKDKDGVMFELQRDDANASLSQVKERGYVFKRIWACLLCLLVCAGLFGASFAFRPKETPPPPPPPPPPEEPFELTELQAKAIEELIAYVNSSEMTSPYKGNIADSLTAMLEALAEAKTVNEKDAVLSTVISYILDQTDQSSIACELMNELWSYSSESTKLMAKVLNYYDWSKLDELDDFTEQIEEFKSSFDYEGENEDRPSEEELLQNFINLLSLTASNIMEAMEKLEVPLDDELYTSLVRLAHAEETNKNGTRLYGLETLAQKASELGLKNSKAELNTALGAVMGDIYKAASQHKTNTTTGEYVLTRIAALFGCEIPKFERPLLFDASVDDGGSGDDGGGAMGGIGSGVTYGSDDLVYDPLTNQFVEYGKILERYNALMSGKLENENYTEEEKQAIQRYFQILYGGFETEE